MQCCNTLLKRSTLLNACKESREDFPISTNVNPASAYSKVAKRRLQRWPYLVQIHHPSGRNVLLLTAQMHRQHSLQRKNSGPLVRQLESVRRLDTCDVSTHLEVKTALCVSGCG